MASFSQIVKEQILESLNTPQKVSYALYGLLSFAKTATDKKILFTTENEDIALFLTNEIKTVCNVKSVSLSKADKRGHSSYSISIEDKDDIDSIFNTIGDIRIGLGSDAFPADSMGYIVAGVFLAIGNVTDPNKEYHLEFVVPSIEVCNDLGLILLDNFSILAKHTSRKNSEIVYIKESENIEDMLTLMGASKATLEVMNVKILKNVRNKVNRVMNCENANIERTVKASEQQIEDIELIEKTAGLGSLSSELYEIAVLRYENPEFTLKELGEALTPKISKSGVNHRLEKIKAIANDIRENGGSKK